MALARIVLKPGVDKQNTEYGAEGGWIDSDYVRFRYGLPEKIGGWTLFNQSRCQYLVGLVSEIYTWNGLDGSPYMIVGQQKTVCLEWLFVGRRHTYTQNSSWRHL
jgi:hypothetical protein